MTMRVDGYFLLCSSIYLLHCSTAAHYFNLLSIEVTVLICCFAVAIFTSVNYTEFIRITYSKSYFQWPAILQTEYHFTFLVPAHPGGPGHIPEEQ